MKDKVILGLQIVVGLLLTLFGANGFLQFMPMPPHSGQMGAWLGAINQTGFIFPIVALTEVIVGLSFISNKFVALSAIIIMPIILNATLAHLFLNDVAGVGAALFVTIVSIIIIVNNKARYSEIFKA